MVPVVAGAVAVMVNDALPLAAPAGNPALSVALQVSSAPALLSGEQLTLDTPLPTATAVALTPAGN